MQKPAICPREEIDSNNFRGKIRVTLAEKLLGRRIEFGLSIFLSFETRTLENQPTSEKNDLISRVIYLRLWRLGCQAVPSFFFFFYPSFSSRQKIARSKSRLSGENIAIAINWRDARVLSGRREFKRQALAHPCYSLLSDNSADSMELRTDLSRATLPTRCFSDASIINGFGAASFLFTPIKSTCSPSIIPTCVPFSTRIFL